MPCGHGRSTSVRKTADRRCRSASKRSIVQSDHKECQGPELALNNFPNRWYTCTIIFLQHNENWKLLPVLPSSQGTDSRNHSDSGASINMDSLESKSPQPESDLSNQRAESAKMILCASPVSVNISEESEGADKAKLHNDSSSTSLTKYLVSCNPSGSVNDDFSPVSPDFLVDGAPKANKSLKRNSKKKGKKKGKQFKKTASKKNSSESDVYHDEGSSNASFVEVSMKNLNSSVDNHVSGDIALPTTCRIRKSKTEKDDIRNDNSSITLVSRASCGDAMDESECMDSPQSFTIDNKPSTIQSPEIILSNYDEDNIGAQCKEDTSLRHKSCSVAVNGFSSSAIDSSLDDWNGDISENYSDDTEIGLTSKEEDIPNSSEGEVTSVSAKFDTSFSTRTMNLCIAEGEMSNNGNPYQSSNVLSVCSDTERADCSGCSGQACSSNGFHPVISGKRARRDRKMTGNGKSECTNRLGAGNSHGRAGRDNVYSVWQKVQKTDTEKLSRLGNHEIASTRDGETSRHKIKLDTGVQLIEKAGKSCRYPSSQVMSKKATCQMVTSAVKSDQPVVKSAAGNYANNVKSKLNSVSKKANHSLRIDSSADASKVSKPLKYHVKKKEALPSSSLVNDTKSRNTTLASVIIPPVLVNQTDRRDNCESKLDQETGISADEATSPSNASSVACGKNTPAECSEQFPRGYDLCKKPTPINSESNGSPTCSIDMHAVPIQYSEDSPSTYSESESSYTEANNVDNSAAAPLQKSKDLGSRGSVTKNMFHVNRLDVDAANEAVLDSSGTKNAEVDKYCSLSSGINRSTCSGSSSRDTDFSSAESTISFRSHSYSVDEIGALSNNQSGQVKNQEICGFQIDLEKIRRFAFDAYKLQTTTENSQSASRNPITDVETFVYSASPVIIHTDHRRRCMICPQEELISQSLCRHQIPDISLRNLWYWYEEPGCFGLEVKAQDHIHSKDFRKASGFNAYFVPYLSAVQLFAKSWSSDYQEPQVEMAMPACGTSTPVSSCLTFSIPPAQSKVNDGELLFEYFESEQPPRRRPLHEKIKDLVSGQTSPSTRIFGDPRKLESVNLRDLHPASWYCVAWYPIYCIPDGNFRAAFLTYHSLGCLIERNFSSSNSNDLRSITSPVVGLQTSNVKGESWFQPRNSDSKPANPSQLVKERLQALKETATIMATAVVSKGGQRSVNHHPDYQFFQSRASRAPYIST